MAIEILIKDITENNRFQKVEAVKKALNGEKFYKVKADSSKALQNIFLSIDRPDREKINKSVRNLSFRLDVPLKSAKGESYYYKSQENLCDRWCEKLSKISSELYHFVINYYNLPEITLMSKAITHNGKVYNIYSPEDGKMINQKDWNKFVDSLQKFLDKNYSGIGKKIVLDATTLGHLLERLSKNSSKESLKNKTLDELKINNKKFDWISDSVKNMTSTFGDSLTREELSNIEVMQASAGQKITRVSDDIKNDVRQILIDGVRGRLSRSQVSQRIFDRMVGINRDVQRIADTEIQNCSNIAYINEAVNKTPQGKKSYFQRVEVIDDNTCSFCERMNGKIAVYSSSTLEDDHIQDDIAEFALYMGNEWDSKNKDKSLHAYTGIFHPWCRGVWIALDDIDIQMIQNKKMEESK